MEKKVTWIRNDQERRVLALEERQDKMLRHAQLAEAWADEVEKVSFFFFNRNDSGNRRPLQPSSLRIFVTFHEA